MSYIDSAGIKHIVPSEGTLGMTPAENLMQLKSELEAAGNSITYTLC